MSTDSTSDQPDVIPEPQTEPTPPKPGFWAVVEVMGHQRYSGFVEEITFAARQFVQITVPEIPDRRSFAKLLSPSAIFAITPVTEEEARRMDAYQRPAPVLGLPGPWSRPNTDDGPSDDEPLGGDLDDDSDLDAWHDPAPATTTNQDAFDATQPGAS